MNTGLFNAVVVALQAQGQPSKKTAAGRLLLGVPALTPFRGKTRPVKGWRAVRATRRHKEILRRQRRNRRLRA